MPGRRQGGGSSPHWGRGRWPYWWDWGGCGAATQPLRFLLRQLPGVESCQNYLFRYGRHPLMELPLMINPTGCARAEPKILTHYKR